MTGNTSLLTVKDLSVVFSSFKGDVCAVNNISFSMGREKLGIVGESGSGKSVTGRAVLRLLPPYARVRASEISLRGKNLLDFSEKQMRKIRGMEISMVMQDPKYSLNPVRTVGEQYARPIPSIIKPGKSRPAKKPWICSTRSGSEIRSRSTTFIPMRCPGVWARES
jgi:ABC-type dipeptide/oligopeptide/nickel transport system, ATPase component